MDTLKKSILERINRSGHITFSEFMEMALYAPDIGYYTSTNTEIGRAGDFYTSPHLHPVFGALVGKQIEEMWEFMGRPRGFEIVELGAGRGYLSKDILDFLRGMDLSEALRYTIVELNPHMAERQRELLAEHGGKVRWRTSLAGMGKVTGCVLSNEVADALPIHIVEMDDHLSEVYVAADGDEFLETLGPPSTELINEYLEEFSIVLPPGYRTEVHLAMKDWIRGISDVLSEGFVLTVDYGYPAAEYYSEDRNRGTLLCYYRHRETENPYEHVGLQDITAHVNFSALKAWGEDLGLRCIGYTRQGPFLVSLGIDQMLSRLHETSPDYGSEVAKIKGLIMPGTMGDTHKVMVQYRGEGSPVLSGFRMKNQAASL